MLLSQADCKFQTRTRPFTKLHIKSNQETVNDGFKRRFTIVIKCMPERTIGKSFGEWKSWLLNN